MHWSVLLAGIRSIGRVGNPVTGLNDNECRFHLSINEDETHYQNSTDRRLDLCIGFAATAPRCGMAASHMTLGSLSSGVTVVPKRPF
jgi:hypothetical protein